MKNSYRKAAILIAETNWFSCLTLKYSVLNYNYLYKVKDYEKIFDLRRGVTFENEQLQLAPEEQQTARVLALEFMHLWEQTGELDDLLQS